MARGSHAEPARPAAGLRLGLPPLAAFAALEVPYYPRLWLSGWLWAITRWMAVFSASYLVNDLTGSPLLVQFVGAAFFAPMFFAGAIGGVISDRFDRKRTILAQGAALSLVAALMSAALLAGVVEVWMVYPIMLAMGIGGVLDMTSRRAFVYDLVGEDRVTNAMALESLALTGSMMLGNLAGGAMIAGLGVGEAFALMAGCYVCSFLLMRGVPSQPRAFGGAGGSMLREMMAGFSYVRRSRTLVSVLGITVLVNTFLFTFMPMVPVFAERLGVDALLTGVLASAMGFGSVVGSLVIAARPAAKRGLYYVGGSVLALVFLFLFAAIEWYPAAVLSLMVVGLGMAGFATMQAVLVMVNASAEMRGRAMGLLSMSIGTLPIAMIILGLVAQETGPQAAVMGSVALGAVAMLLWNVWFPEARKVA